MLTYVFDAMKMYGIILLLFVFLLWLIFSLLRTMFTRRKTKLLGTSIYNFEGVMELHIDTTSGWEAKLFISLVAKAIKQAREGNKEILFSTWLVSRKTIEKHLDKEALTFYTPSLTDRVFFFLAKTGYRVLFYIKRVTSEQFKNRPVPKTYPLIKVIINTSMLSDNTMKKLSRRVQEGDKI